MSVALETESVLALVPERRQEMVRLGDVIDVVRGASPRPKGDPRYFGGTIPWISISDITRERGKYLSRSREFVTEAGAQKSRLLRAGTLILSNSGTVCVPKILAVDGCIHDGFVAFPNLPANFDKNYLYWFFEHIRPSIIEANRQGITQVNLNTGIVREIRLPKVSLDQQLQVAAEIETQFSRLDEAVANLQRVKANLKRYRASVLKAAVDGTIFPDLSARAWRQARVGDVAEVISGLTKSPKRNSLTMKLPYLRVANVYANELRLDEMEYIGVADKELQKLLVRRGDLLLVEGNGSPDQIGRVALWDESIPNCVHQNHLIKVRLAAEIVPEWALTWLLSPRGRHEIEQVSASTSGLHTLSTGKVSRLPIHVPPLYDQRRIVAEVDRRLSLVRAVGLEVGANLDRAQALRQSVLSAKFGAGGVK